MKNIAHSRVRLACRCLITMSLSMLFAQATGLTQVPSEHRLRARQLGIVVGRYPAGPLNAITDVPGVMVGQTTMISGSGPLKLGEGPIRTGVTAILPRSDIWSKGVFAATYSFNGDGEMTGTHWIQDLETLNYPIMLTSTGSVGSVDDAVMEYTATHHPEHKWDFLPVVAETFDGFLNDLQGRHVRYKEVEHALDTASGGSVAEGNVGGGTGMICFRFKCGTGTSSRVLPASDGGYTIGVLVQANFGAREQLTIAGVPVGAQISDALPTERKAVAKDNGKEGSIIIVLATDAPLSSRQLERLAKRAALGMARTGSTSGNTSGDLFISFSTGNVIPLRAGAREMNVRLLSTDSIEPIFRASVEATEEAILNALTMGSTMEGVDGHIAYGISYDKLAPIMAKYGHPLTYPAP